MRIPNMIFLIVAVTVLSVMAMSTGVTAAELEPAFPDLSFTRPVDLQHAGDGSDRLFVVQQRGVISVFANDPDVTGATVFLDISDRVVDSGNEQGLLGLAFHPSFPDNGWFYVNYTAANPARTVISRFTVSETDPNVADPSSEVVILEVPQPYSNHNGGQIAFGPDGYLYIAFGDGGSGGDPHGNGQNRATLLGAIARIDVNASTDSTAYGIPPGNPFAGNNEGFREELFAYGLRNPWRFSFDSATGTLWAADVGQNAFEEVDIIISGGNYGWNIMEGMSCYNAASCDNTGLVMPVIAYGRGEGQSITGGFVYHGSRAPSLTGAYVYADYVSGNLWALWYDGGTVTDQTLLGDTGLNISSFGIDESGELYVLAFDGAIYRFVAQSTPVEGDTALPRPFTTAVSYPNPFNAATTLAFSLPAAREVTVSAFNIAGQKVDDIFGGYLAPGAHTVRWAPDGLSGGVYFMRLSARDRAGTVRVVYLP